MSNTALSKGFQPSIAQEEEKRQLAAQSAAWARQNRQLAAMFPQQLQEAGGSARRGTAGESGAPAAAGARHVPCTMLLWRLRGSLTGLD